MPADINLNSAQCLNTATSWGHDTVYNICTGSHFIVPWGSIDYVAATLLIALGLTLVISFVSYVIKEVFFDY